MIPRFSFQHKFFTVFVHDPDVHFLLNTSFLPFFVHDPDVHFLLNTSFLPLLVHDPDVHFLLNTSFLPLLVHDPDVHFLLNTSFLPLLVHGLTYIVQPNLWYLELKFIFILLSYFPGSTALSNGENSMHVEPNCLRVSSWRFQQGICGHL